MSNLLKMGFIEWTLEKFSARTFTLIFLIALTTAGCASQQQQEKDDVNLKARARAHTDLGAVYFQQKQMEVALEEFTLATKIDPNFSLAYNGLGLVHAALGQDDIAEMNFKRAIQIEPNNSESRNNYGSFLCARNRIDESIKEFLAAVKNPLYSTPAMAYTNAGICSLRKQDSVNAEIYFQRALQIEPLLNIAAYQLSSMQFKRNDVVGAKNTLQNVMLGQPTPDMLWLAIQIERVLGAKDEEASYSLELRRQYPDSEQAKLLRSGK
ncbi:MAG: type IV pilus biogenesis/stability protein PilW [Methylotenera sp.]|nr:type IV pilus biogenesis/stability protein PilW [Methylotenera sp.]MDP1753996.1 type IV pilus biogenesis/stability protein PilW [Methylotenera sp.]MDP1960363.1 type IV pilus biogenesis/stability protein PilW [Methylotenera sp.]MDP3206840.1 type IV pilus biogenesis/stability protein PilW [Methylotenera sp.]MDP3302837.1 type IV pilus biogenesis/stability protein PilW [Methylotenera sp.]